MKEKMHNYTIGIFVSLYIIVSTISTIHSIEFFKLSNPLWLAVSLAIAFEVGAMASLAGLVILDKANKNIIWALFITLTLMQCMSNVYYCYTNLQDYTSWSELFGLVDETEILQKRVISLVEGVFLPLISLGFIKSLIDYLRPEVEKIEQHKEEESKEEEEVPNIDDDHADLTRPVSRWPNSFKNK